MCNSFESVLVCTRFYSAKYLSIYVEAAKLNDALLKFRYSFDMQKVFQSIWEKIRKRLLCFFLKKLLCWKWLGITAFSQYKKPLPVCTYCTAALRTQMGHDNSLGAIFYFIPAIISAQQKTVWSSQPIKQDQEEKKGNAPNPREKIWPALKSPVRGHFFFKKNQ